MLSLRERTSIAEDFIREYEELVKRRSMPLERSARMDLTEELECYWNAWKVNFRTKESAGFFGEAAYLRLSFRFYAIAGKKWYKDAHGYCQDILHSSDAEPFAWYYFADLQYQYGDAGKTDDESVIRELLGYYWKSWSGAIDQSEKNAAAAAIRGYIRHIGRYFPESEGRSRALAEEIIWVGWDKLEDFSIAVHTPGQLKQPSEEWIESSISVDNSTTFKSQYGNSSKDDSIKRRFEDAWKDFTVGVITTDKGVKLIKDMKREGVFRDLGLINDRWIEAFDAFKESHRSIYEFLNYDLILVGENDHVFRDMEWSGKGNAVATFLSENKTNQIVLELRRWQKPPKTDRSVILDKTKEAKEIFLENLMKAESYSTS